MKVQLIQTAILPGIEFEAWLQLVYGRNVNDMCEASVPRSKCRQLTQKII